MKIARALLLAAVLRPALLAAQARADSARADSLRAVGRLEGIRVTGARVPATVGGSGVVVVRPDSLRTSAAPLLDEALRETPFVLVRQNSRGEMELSVRGSDSRQAAVMLDGVPLTLGWDHRADPSLVPLSGVQSLTLVRGLSSLLHGPNVLGGVIELGVAGDATGERERVRVWAGAGVDQYGSRVLSVGGALPLDFSRGSLTLRGGGSHRARDGFRVPADAGDTTATDELRTNSDLRHHDVFGSARWEGTDGRYVGATTSAFRAERGVPPELHVASPRLWRYPAQSRTFAALSAGSGVVTTPFGTGRIEASAGYNAGSLEIESFMDRRYTALDGRELGDERTNTGRVLASHSVGAGEVRAAFTGADVRYEETLDADTPRDYRQTLTSAGAELTWPVGARATVGGGLVRDAAATPESGGKPSLGRVDAWGWRAGATLRASDALRVHASASRRARFPALRELYSGALDRFRPNPALRPETLTGIEAGVTLDALGARHGGLSMQAVGFHHQLADAVVRTTVPGTRLFVRVNRDAIRSTGLELLGTWRSAAAHARAVTISGDVLAQRVRVHDDSARAERRPEHQPELRGSLEVGVPLPAMLRATAAMRHTGAQYCVHPDAGTQVRLGAQTEGNLALERRWTLGGGIFRGLRALLALDNVADAAVYDQCGLPQPGRTLRLGVQVD